MTRFKANRPNQNVRLREWGPGRIAQLKLFLAHLEQNVNNSLAAQVVQSSKRKFSEFVPIVPIQDINIDVEFRELRVDFTPPKGLKRFLFYEWQISTDSNFASFTRYLSPEPSFVFSSIADGATNYIRLRVVTTDGLVGPWSEAVTGTTPRARSIQTFDGSRFESRVFTTDWVDLWEITHEALGGDAAYYTIMYQVETSRLNNTIGWSDLELRWLVDDKQQGQTMMFYAFASNDDDMEVTTADTVLAGSLVNLAPYDFIQRGTLVQKVTTFTEGTHTISMQGRLQPNANVQRPNDYTFVDGTRTGQQPAIITFRNFSLFEVITSA